MDGAGRRLAAVNALMERVGSSLPPLGDDAGLEGGGRARYERELGLPKGALAWGRFEGEGAELAGWTVARIVARLDRERSSPSRGQPTPEAATMSPEAYLAETFADLGLEPGQTLWLTGSPDVRRALEAVGASAPLLRSGPSQDQLRGYAVAVMCRGRSATR